MAQSNLSIITTRGVRGKDAKFSGDMGDVVAFIDDEHYISVDAFIGTDETYRRRENCAIEIINNGLLVFYGTFEELCNKLK